MHATKQNVNSFSPLFLFLFFGLHREQLLRLIDSVCGGHIQIIFRHGPICFKLLAASMAGILFYFLYPGIELVTGLWGASYMVERLGASPVQAAISITLFWTSLAAGRFLTGLLAARISNTGLLRLGLLLAISGGLFMTASGSLPLCRLALLLIGLGLSPLYPTMMHDTPRRLGYAHGDRLIGFQVGAALAGSALIPALAGVAMARLGLSSFGWILLAFGALVLAAHEISLKNSLLPRRRP